jgi:hypothetical protein
MPRAADASQQQDARMTDLSKTFQHFAKSLQNSRHVAVPYDYWLLHDVLPNDICEELAALPFVPAAIGDTLGKRETHNSTRIFCDAANRRSHPAMAAVAALFQDRGTTQAIEETCHARLAGTSLRIEYCQDTAGFWLEPHTDLGVKKFTMMIYVCRGEGSEDWGTDIYDSRRRHVARSPCGFNKGLIFVPADNTFHGFERRNIAGIRKALIVNYVGPEWRSRHELAYPEQPIS